MATRKKRGFLKTNPVSRFFRWMFTSSTPSYRNDAPAPRKKGAAKPQKQKKAAAKERVLSEAAEEGLRLGYVDKNGNVRLKADGRIVGLTTKKNKAEALAEAVEAYRAHQAVAEEFAARSDFRLIDDIAALRQAVKDAPGLGDFAALNSTLDGHHDRIVAVANDVKARKQAVLAAIDALPDENTDGSPDWAGADQQLLQLKADWTRIGTASSLFDGPLETRHDATLESYAKRKAAFSDDHTGNLARKNQLLRELIRLAEHPDDRALTDTLSGIDKRWKRIGAVAPADEEQLEADFLQLKSDLFEQYADALADEETRQAALDEKRATALAALRALPSVTSPRSLSQNLRQLERTFRDLHARDRAHDYTDSFKTLNAEAARLAHLDEQQDRERAATADRRTAILARAEQLAEADKHKVIWKDADKELLALIDEARELPHMRKTDRGEMLSALRAAHSRMKLNRAAFYDAQADKREASAARKQVLINDLPLYPHGASAADLRDRLDRSMEAWKAAGSAGREHDDDLWAAYRAQRDTLYEAIRMLRDQETEDFRATLSHRFERRKEEIYRLEREIAHEEMLADASKDEGKTARLRKEAERKKGWLKKAQDDVVQIQRRLAKLAKQAESRKAAAEGASDVAKGADSSEVSASENAPADAGSEAVSGGDEAGTEAAAETETGPREPAGATA